MKKVAIIIVNWNGKKDTIENLSSLAKLNKTNLDIETIVVDNASSDDSVSSLKKVFPDITLLPQEKNLGFTGANNVGIKYALTKQVDYLWIVNNDTTVDKNSLVSLVDAYTKEGIYGSKIYFSAGQEYHKDRYKESDKGNVLWYAGGIIDWANMYASHRGVDEVDKGQYDERSETAFVSGCSLFTSSFVFQSIGMFDDRYFAYLEDVDLCMRAKKKGFGLYFTPSSQVWHKNAGSTNGPGNKIHEYYMTRNRLLFGFTYAPLRTKLALVRESISFACGSNTVRRKAVLDGFTGKFGKATI